jgi:catechol 2,3-dioxygenase-like lactoylglutathione lyase family enzyme
VLVAPTPGPAALHRERDILYGSRMGILDHISLVVSDYSRSKTFYEKALAPLGIAPLMEFGSACGLGRDGKPEFWIGTGPASFQRPEHLKIITPTHLAFAARSRAEVDAFYRAAVAAGGKDFGAPGVRAHYHPNYYGAFVLDPDGHDIEAVFHGAP